MDELDEALEKTRLELEAALRELASVRERRGGAALAELAAALQEVQAATVRQERENDALDERLAPRRAEVEKLRAELSALRPPRP